MENIKGIIISVSKYKDFDAIINILTENQIMPVLGRGIFKNENIN